MTSSNFDALTRSPSSASTSTREIAPVMAMKPSCTPMCSRIDIAITVPRNHTTTIVANSGFGMLASTPRLAMSVTRLCPRKP